jgi:arginase
MGGSKVAVFGVPTAAGTRAPGVSQAPLRLREAGLLRALEATGARVVNLSDLSLFPSRADEEHPNARNASGVACAVRAGADEMTRALAEGFTVVLGGDCSLVAGTMAGAQRYLAPDHVSLVGFRALDPGERAPLGDLGLALPASAARRLGMTASAALALDGVGNEDGPLVVHLDVDVIDPLEMPAKSTLTPGEALGFREVSDLVTGILASPRVVALEVCEYNPERDDDALTCGRKLVELVARAVARRLRA